MKLAFSGPKTTWKLSFNSIEKSVDLRVEFCLSSAPLYLLEVQMISSALVVLLSLYEWNAPKRDLNIVI